jgi:type IV pilus assembly protein PilC
MPTFTYEAKSPTGQVERGTMEADTSQVVARTLRAQGFYVVSVESARRETLRTPVDVIVRRGMAPVFYPVSSKATAGFFASLSALLSAGMNMSEALMTLSERTRNGTLRRAAREMAEAAVDGRPMSSVVDKYPSAFSPATIAAIEAGEESGLIDQMADRLAKYFDRVFELEQIYRWQTFYPKVLVIAAVIIPTVPVLVIKGFDPWISLVLTRGVPVLLGIAALWYGWRLLMQVSPVRHVIDRIKLLIPWFGSLSRRVATARWARALAMLSAAGVPVHRALVAAASASGNRAMEEALVHESAGVLRGRTLAEVVRDSREIPAMAVDMLATAERAGSIEGALEKVAEYYESETEVGGKQTALALAVLAYLIVAAIIAFMVITFWQGYFQDLGVFME